MPISFKNKPGLVIYLTAGDPDLATTREMAVAAIDNGADVIELGVPFSDPLADGPVIQRASERAVARGTRLSDVLDCCLDIRRLRPDAGILLFSYLNPVMRMGLAEFARQARAGGADGVLLTDMIVEEAAEYLRVMRENELVPVFLAAPTSPAARLQAIAEHSGGFVYAISRVGITGTQKELAADARALVDRVRRYTDLPIALGFGVSTPEHVRTVSEFADAAVVGSAIVGLVERTPAAEAAAAVGAFVRALKGAGVAEGTQIPFGDDKSLFRDESGKGGETTDAAGIGGAVEAGSVAGEEPVTARG
jgi:tryptophan synthase alpha chain